MDIRNQWRSLRRSFRILLTRVLPVLFTPILLYLVIVAIGLIPVNNDFQSAPDGIEVKFTSSLIHADIVLPIANDIIDWRQEFSPDLFAGDTSSAQWVVLGWGDREYFAQLPTWHNSQFLSALRALFWPSESCMQVHLARGVRSHQEMRSVRLTPAQYHQIVRHIQHSLRRQNDGSVQLIPGANRGKHDIFLEANGLYSALNTCNNWIGRIMQTGGIRTGWFTPLPKTAFLYLAQSGKAN
ncbi:MAG: TIGR02117 family protein [Cyanobacteria bacterium P01_D01_bin.73]